jgi:hypothetical protein
VSDKRREGEVSREYALPDGRKLVVEERLSDGTWILSLGGVPIGGQPLSFVIADLLGYANEPWPQWIDDLARTIESEEA